MKKRWLFILIGAIAILAIMGVLLRSQGSETSDLYVQPKRGPFRVTVTTTGELKAKNSVKIYGPTGARQIQIYQIKIERLVPEGTVVAQGDFVAELDRSELNTKMNDANLELQKAQSQYEQAMLDTLLNLSKERDNQVNLRYAMEEALLLQEQATFEAPSVKRQAEIDFEKSERGLAQAIENYQTQVKQGSAKMSEVGAELSKAQNKLQMLAEAAQQFTIQAPENGMVVYHRDWQGKKLTTGGMVNVWDPIVAELPDLSVMESITYINEVDIQKISAGQPVEIGLDADPDKRLNGSVARVANIGEQRPNSDAKVFEVAIDVAGADTTLRPAMTTSNTIVVADIPEALYVPLETIHTQDSLTYVFARRSGRTVRQEVHLGLLNENEVIVEDGLTVEDRLYLSLPTDTTGMDLQRLEPQEAIAAKGSE
ncbi:MAG: HlyD family efflux transporter periplasmic adaptor subunit [Chloroflexi bacterium]|nr:HlyD family efflux transporter periplasmic adaptor subunit [Chloroflexota bacterium]